MGTVQCDNLIHIYHGSDQIRMISISISSLLRVWGRAKYSLIHLIKIYNRLL